MLHNDMYQETTIPQFKLKKYQENKKKHYVYCNFPSQLK